MLVVVELVELSSVLLALLLLLPVVEAVLVVVPLAVVRVLLNDMELVVVVFVL